MLPGCFNVGWLQWQGSPCCPVWMRIHWIESWDDDRLGRIVQSSASILQLTSGQFTSARWNCSNLRHIYSRIKVTPTSVICLQCAADASTFAHWWPNHPWFLHWTKWNIWNIKIPRRAAPLHNIAIFHHLTQPTVVIHDELIVYVDLFVSQEPSHWGQISIMKSFLRCEHDNRPINDQDLKPSNCDVYQAATMPLASSICNLFHYHHILSDSADPALDSITASNAEHVRGNKSSSTSKVCLWCLKYYLWEN